MAKSKAQKMRAHAARNGRRDPALNRGESFDFSTVTKRTPTLAEKKRRAENKHKKRLAI